MKDPSRFDPLEHAVESPFAAALKFQQEIEGYLQYVEEEFTQIRLIGQDEEDPNAVRLAQVFVALRAYCERDVKAAGELEAQDAKVDRLRGSNETDENRKRHVFDLFSALEEWIASAARRDWMRLISGGPGIGKSSSMRALAARLARNGRAYPIYVPLQKLDRPMEPLRSRIAHYLISTKAIPFSQSPLESEDRVGVNGPILLIFDGLDELVRPGRDADEIARDFMVDLQRLLEEENGSRGRTAPRILAVVTGRISAAESAARSLKCSGDQVLWLLPFVVEEDRAEFVDRNNLLKDDQRKRWWQLWAKASSNVPQDVPRVLLTSDLFDITAEPLLLYFVAFVRPWEAFGEDRAIDRNWLYGRLLNDFYRRECEKGDRNFATEFDSFDSYEIVLEAMAMAAWYDGSTRIGTIEVVRKLLHDWDSQIEESFNQVVGSNKPAVSAALAFYMRPGEIPNSFEFLHKTFAEYLVGGRLLKAVRDMDDSYRESLASNEKRKRPFDPVLHLQNWLRLTGPREIDVDVLQFLRDEVYRMYRTDRQIVKQWCDALVHLFHFCLKNRLPAHSLGQLPDEKLISRPQNFVEMIDQERNAEQTLLACLNATILPQLNDPSFKPIDVRPDGGRTYMGQMLSRVRGQRVGPQNIGLTFFAGLDLSNEMFHVQDAYRMDARRADLSHSEWHMANLANAQLQGAILTNAVLWQVNFESADLRGADLRGASLEGARLTRAQLTGANLSRAILRDADLRSSDLQGAKIVNAQLTKALLFDADLRGADLSGAVLNGANLRRAKLKSAKLTNAKMKNVILEEASDVTELQPDLLEQKVTGKDKKKIR